MAEVKAWWETTDTEARATLEAIGEKRLRHLLSQGMLVSHLMQPAYAWLDELDKAQQGKDGHAAD